MTTGAWREQPDLRSFGIWTEPQTFKVERARIAAYAAATNDTTDAHVRGDVAGPVFAVLPAWTTAYPLLLSTLSEPLRRRTLHGEQDITYHRPLVPGMVLRTNAAIVGAMPTSRGVTVTARAVSVNTDGETILDQYTTLIVRNASIANPLGSGAPVRMVGLLGAGDGLVCERESALDADQTRRYAEASGDFEGIHLNEVSARKAGFASVVNHGNCTFAIASAPVIDSTCAGDVGRLRRLAVRFSRAVTLDDVITTRVWAGNEAGAARAFSWESTSAGGSPCLTNGYAEVVR